MLTFKTFHTLLKESVGPDTHIKHLNHPEDGIFDGKDSFHYSHNLLHQMNNHLKGQDSAIDHVSTKTDGSVSLVFGHHPKSGKFFVGTKSVFNKDPKINYNDEDIERNHGHAPGLVDTLKHALKHLPKVAGKHGVYQSDLVFGDNQKEHNESGIHFKPNTITYSVDKSHPDFHHIKDAKIGLAIHTKYEGEPETEHDLNGMAAKPFFGREQLHGHKDVHITDNRYKLGVAKVNHKQVEHHLGVASKIAQGLDDNAHHAISVHSATLNTYINKTIRDGSDVHLDAYRSHLSDKLMKDVEKAKSESGKAKKLAVHDEAVSHFDNNKHHIAKAFEIHKHMQSAKNEIVRGMNQADHYYGHSFKGNKTDPEGYAVTDKSGSTHKLVDRAEFSKNNFMNSAERFGR